MKSRNLFFLLVAVLVVAETRAYAYTDPGSGVLIWQMLAAAFFGLMFYLRRIIGWVRRVARRKEEASSVEPLPADTVKETESV